MSELDLRESTRVAALQSASTKSGVGLPGSDLTTAELHISGKSHRVSRVTDSEFIFGSIKDRTSFVAFYPAHVGASIQRVKPPN